MKAAHCCRLVILAGLSHGILSCGTTDVEVASTPVAAPIATPPASPAGGPPGLAPDALAAVRAQQDQRAAAARSAWLANRTVVPRPDDSDLRIDRMDTDRFGITHTRLRVTVGGVPLHGAELIAHTDATGATLEPSIRDDWKAPAVVRATAKIGEVEASRIALSALGSPSTIEPPRARLYYHPVTPDAPWQLVYVVTTFAAHPEGARQWEQLVSAESGAVLATRDITRHGIGTSYYSGTVKFSTYHDTQAGLYKISDLTRGGLGGFYNDVLVYQADGNHVLYTNPIDLWGTGNPMQCPFVEACLTPDGRTDAVDAAHGVARAWDVYRLYDREGPLGGVPGAPVKTLVHMPEANAEAGEGTIALGHGEPGTLIPFTAVGIVGHEMGHLFFRATVGPSEPGLPSAVNEAVSDIMGILTEFHPLGAPASEFYVVSNWTINEQVEHPLVPRYFYRPSLDGRSFDYIDSPGFSPTGDPHDVSGPMRRAFYFMANGAPAVVPGPPSDYTTTKVPEGFPGIGINAAAFVWVNMLLHWLPLDPSFDATRAAALSSAGGAAACSELFKTTQDAFAAVGVGTKSDRIKPTISAFTVTQSADYTTVTYEGTATDSNAMREVTVSDTEGFTATAAGGHIRRVVNVPPGTMGLRGVTFTAKDRCGNIASTIVLINLKWPPTGVVIVPDAPSGTLQKTFACPTCQSTNQQLTRVDYYGDTTAGIQGTEALLGSATADRPWRLTKNFTAAQQGRWYIYGIGRQLGGLTATSPEIISYVDSTPPHVDSGWVDRQVLRPNGFREVDVRVRVTDNIRVDYCRFNGLTDNKRVDNDSVTTPTETLGVTLVGVVPDGQHTVTVTCFDETGNSGSGSFTVRVGGDHPTPHVCNEVVTSGGNQPQVWEVDLGEMSGTVEFGRRTYHVADKFLIRCRDGGTFGQTTQFATPCEATENVIRFASSNFNCSSPIVEIEVIPNCQGTPDTVWDFKMECPN